MPLSQRFPIKSRRSNNDSIEFPYSSPGDLNREPNIPTSLLHGYVCESDIQVLHRALEKLYRDGVLQCWEDIGLRIQ